jgi:hypothetical protein
MTAALTALALVAAGCGDSDDDGTTDSGAATLTKAEFVKQANAICAANNKEIDAEFQKFGEENNLSEKKQPTQEQLEEAADDFLLPMVNDQIDELRGLEPPEAEAGAFEALLDEAEAEAEKLEDDPSTLDEQSFAKVNERARALGLQACGEE